MPAGLLGAGLLLCMEGGQINRKGIAGSWLGGATLIAWEVCMSARDTVTVFKSRNSNLQP